AVLAAAPRLLPHDPARGDGGLDVPGTATVTLGLVALVYGLTGGRPVVAALGVAALAAFALIQRRAADPLVPPALLRTGTVGTGNLLMLPLGMVWVGTFFFLPLYQQRVLSHTPLVAGLTQLPLAAALMAAPLVAGRIRTTPVPGLLVLAAGLTWLARVPADGAFLPDLLGPLVLVGIGLGLSFVPITALGVTGVPAHRSGVAGGLVNTSRQVGGALGLSLLTSVAGLAPADRIGYRHAFLAAAALSLLAATAAALKGRTA
ncbi:MAG TPA: MFS transporter, partial [Thermomonospora sp.]|nr:MFS transporter [Thermomonospora sp.]